MLFVRGAGNCVQCNTPLRKNNFRVQLFEDPTVDKEVEIRKKVMKMWVKGGAWDCEVKGCGSVCLCAIPSLLPFLKLPLSLSLHCLFCRQWVSLGGFKWVGSFSARFYFAAPPRSCSSPLIFFLIPLNWCSNVCLTGSMQKWYYKSVDLMEAINVGSR